MLAFVFIAVLVNFSCQSCSSIGIKPFPEYKGVDPRAESIVKEYKELARIQGIVFKNEVTVGFKTINRGTVIGICTRAPFWHEVDLDLDFWNSATQTSRLALVLHELSHCYCERGHDWGNAHDYPETSSERLKEILDSLAEGKVPPGRYDDNCPQSLMFPEILTDGCVKAHYGDYSKEIFDRCEPY